MVAGSRGDGGAPQYKISSKLQATVDSVREIVGPHSESEILAVLRETNMDANETVQRLLYQDPFHEVKSRRDRKKESAGPKDSTHSGQPRVQTDHSTRLIKTLRPLNRSTRVADPGTGQKFRVVRDNRGNQNANEDLRQEVPHRSILGNGRIRAIFRDKSSFGHRDFANHSSGRTEERIKVSVKDGDSTKKKTDNGTHHTGSNLVDSSSVIKGVDPEITVLSSSSSGVYASSSDPVHVPSPDSRSAGIVGVVGGRRHSSEHPVSLSSLTNSSIPVHQLGKDISSGTFSVGHSKAALQTHLPTSDHGAHASRPYSSHQYHSKPQANMEWRPKSSQKSSIGDKLPAPSSSADKSPSNEEVTALTGKLSESNIIDSKHVIIPNHLRVPEAERAGLTFGSFASNFDSHDTSTSNTSISAVVGSGEVQNDPGDVQGRNSQSSSPPSSSLPDGAHLDERDSSKPKNAGNYDQVGLVQSQNASFDEPKPEQMHNVQSLQTFSETYDPQHSYEVPFFASGIEDGIHGQRLSSPAEASSGMGMMQHQAMMYPQVHLSHYPNFMPYRQIISPMYVPPMAIPSYSNPAYAHPSASSYLLMPGTTSHLKYPAPAPVTPQYKPLSYPADDINRIKFKDSNPYSHSPQVDGSEIWIQSQRDIPGPFYGLASQTPHTATYLPTAGAVSSHMQFPGVYHHPGQAAQMQMTGSHHLMPATAAGNGVAALPPQVGSYQQHLNWTSNF